VPSAGTARNRNDAKAKGDPYFVSCRAGAEEAARGRRRGLDLGRTATGRRQAESVGGKLDHAARGPIAVAVENQAGISTVLRKAREHGIRVLTWDADAELRRFLRQQATPEASATP
jgi:rhamnose transport system permease protein